MQSNNRYTSCSNNESALRPAPRNVAASFIKQWLQKEAFPDRLLEQVSKDRAFITELVLGVVRWRRSLEWVQTRWVKKTPRVNSQCFMFMGMYETLYLSHVPSHVTVDETVEAAKSTISKKEIGFLNAVLRRCMEQKKQVLADLKSQPLGIRCSHPQLLMDRWTCQLGMKRTAKLALWNNQRSRMILRVYTPHISSSSYLGLLESKGIRAYPHPYDPAHSIVLLQRMRVKDLPGFEDGYFFVQDPAAGLSVSLLDPQPGDRILDACAAPGGKTLLIAEAMMGNGTLVAMDRYEERLQRLLKNLERFKLNRVKTFIGDGRAATSRETALTLNDQQLFDKILLDVPCTNTGVIRRRPDARWRFNLERLQNLYHCQWDLLSSFSSLLSETGQMVYSTCSLEPEEDEHLVSQWLEKYRDFELVQSRKLIPSERQTDGAYVALIRRKSLR